MRTTLILLLIFVACACDDNKIGEGKDNHKAVLEINNDSIEQQLFGDMDYIALSKYLPEDRGRYLVHPNKFDSAFTDSIYENFGPKDTLCFLKARGEFFLGMLSISSRGIPVGKVKIGDSKMKLEKMLGREQIPNQVIVSSLEGRNDYILFFKDDRLVNIRYHLEFLD